MKLNNPCTDCFAIKPTPIIMEVNQQPADSQHLTPSTRENSEIEFVSESQIGNTPTDPVAYNHQASTSADPSFGGPFNTMTDTTENNYSATIKGLFDAAIASTTNFLKDTEDFFMCANMPISEVYDQRAEIGAQLHCVFLEAFKAKKVVFPTNSVNVKVLNSILLPIEKKIEQVKDVKNDEMVNVNAAIVQEAIEAEKANKKATEAKTAYEIAA
ncbi:hypothetical protein ACKWTF_012120 [Chironomus riparius]